MSEKPEGLSKEHERFVDEYLIDLNATRAYADVYPESSYESARRLGSLLLTNVDVQAAIAEAKQVRSERTHITQDRVLLEIARLAFNDPRRAFDASGNLLPVQQWPDEVAAAVSSIKVKRVMEGENQVEVSEIKFWDKGKQIEIAGKHLGIFEKDNKQKAALTVKLDADDLNL